MKTKEQAVKESEQTMKYLMETFEHISNRFDKNEMSYDTALRRKQELIEQAKNNLFDTWAQHLNLTP